VYERPRIGGDVCDGSFSETTLLRVGGRFCAFFSGREIPFPGNGDSERQRLGSNAGYAEGSPSIWCCRDHSAGMSARRATPMPRGSRPAMAAFTRSGARKASEIVMLTLRMLHRSRLAMLSAFAFASARSSSSQRRPRAIDATRSARDSERIGRAPGSGAPFGRRNGNYRHGHFTAAAKEQRRRLRSLIRDARKMVRSLI
jgi:hypothetical protein